MLYDTSVSYGGTIQRVSTLPERVQMILNMTGWSGRELARRSGLATSHVSLIRKRASGRVAPETLSAIAKATGCSYQWLATGEGEPGQLDPPSPDEVPQEHPDPEITTLPIVRNAITGQLLAAAKALRPGHPQWVWTKTCRANLLLNAPLTPLALAELADFISRHETPDEPPPRPRVLPPKGKPEGE